MKIPFVISTKIQLKVEIKKTVLIRACVLSSPKSCDSTELGCVREQSTKECGGGFIQFFTIRLATLSHGRRPRALGLCLTL